MQVHSIDSIEWMRLCPFLRCHDTLPKLCPLRGGRVGKSFSDLWEAIRKCEIQTLYWRYKSWEIALEMSGSWFLKSEMNGYKAITGYKLFIVCPKHGDCMTEWELSSVNIQKNLTPLLSMYTDFLTQTWTRNQIQIWSMKQVRQGWNNLQLKYSF